MPPLAPLLNETRDGQAVLVVDHLAASGRGPLHPWDETKGKARRSSTGSRGKVGFGREGQVLDGKEEGSGALAP